ncbi:30S ribosomal protein S3 [archaeon]|nr:30S ribosomal protein S3 [archaeon]
MIERDFISQKTKEYYIKNHISSMLKGAEISEVNLKKIPLGEKIVVTTNRPSLVVGSKGSNIRKLTQDLKTVFGLENPQVEIKEVPDANLDAEVVAQRIASTLERYGSARFKGTGHKVLSDVMGAGALGVEIKISGKIPGSRAKSWRFYMGYLKKCGDISVSGVLKAYAAAQLKSGVVGIQVRIMPKDVVLPDTVEILDEAEVVIEEEATAEEKKDKKSGSKKKATKKKSTKKKTTKKKVEKKKTEVVEKGDGEKVAPEPVKEKVTAETETKAETVVEETKKEIKEVKEEAKEEVTKEESKKAETVEVKEQTKTTEAVPAEEKIAESTESTKSEEPTEKKE